MEQVKLLRKDYLDILFEGRNKAYGGYELRRKYAIRARKACIGVVLGVAGLATVPVIASSLSPKEKVMLPVTAVYKLREIEIAPKEIQPPMHIAAPPPPVATIRNPELRIVRDEEPTEQPPTIEQVQKAQPSLETTEGPSTNTSIAPTGPTGSGTALVETKENGTGIATQVDQMPEFEGSLEAYLRRNLRYPDEARMSGTEGRVGIQFVVNEDGSISGAEVFHKASSLLDAEALRVVKAMPKWKPGKQGGKAVKCYFTLPITFALF